MQRFEVQSHYGPYAFSVFYRLIMGNTFAFFKRLAYVYDSGEGVLLIALGCLLSLHELYVWYAYILILSGCIFLAAACFHGKIINKIIKKRSMKKRKAIPE